MWLVIFGHAFVDRSHAVRSYIYSFHMPLFFFISGLTYKRRSISFGKFVKKKAIAFLIPYVALNVFVGLIKYFLHFTLHMYNDLSLKFMLKGMLTGDGANAPCIQSWFLLTLFITEIIFYGLDRLIRSETGLFISSLLVAALGWAYSRFFYYGFLFWHLDVAFFAVLFFWAGYFFKNHLADKVEKLSAVWKWILCVAAIGLGALLQTVNGRTSMNSSYYGQIHVFILAALFSIFGVTLLSMVLLKKIPFINNVGKNSIFYLGYHAFVLTIVKTFLPILCSTWYLTLLVSLLSLFINYYPAIYLTKYVPVMVGKWWKKS